MNKRKDRQVRDCALLIERGGTFSFATMAILVSSWSGAGNGGAFRLAVDLWLSSAR